MVSITKLTTNMMVKDVTATVEYYKANYGFILSMAVPESLDGIHEKIEDEKKYLYALMKSGDVEIMFQEAENLRKDVPGLDKKEIGASATFYFEVKGIDELYSALSNKVEVVKEIVTTWYGTREFYVRDCNGYILGFAENQ
jgi:uncharacterized glyoxalase superfamily protein PhnB